MASLKRGLGVGLAAGLFAAAVLTGTTAARAADPPATPLTVTKHGYFTNKITGALPPVLVKEVPPSVVCILVPQLCNSGVDALKVALSLNDGLPLPDIPDYLVPQPVPPGELPVGMLGGATRYTATAQFDLPSITPKATVNTFNLVIKDGALSFSIESPTFREAILAGLSQYPVQQPEVLSKFIDDVTSQATPLLNFEPTGIQACMVTSAWDAGDSQDPATTPKTDCDVGGLGKHDAAAKTWTFDISGVVQSWVDGKPNMGISLAPLGAQNVAYGDPDPSTNFIITLQSGFTAAFAVGPPPTDDAPVALAPEVPSGDALGAAGTLPDTSGTSSGTGSDLALQTGASSTASTPAKARLASASTSTPWWVWLIVPFILAGAAALSASLSTRFPTSQPAGPAR